MVAMFVNLSKRIQDDMLSKVQFKQTTPGYIIVDVRNNQQNMSLVIDKNSTRPWSPQVLVFPNLLMWGFLYGPPSRVPGFIYKYEFCEDIIKQLARLPCAKAKVGDHGTLG